MLKKILILTLLLTPILLGTRIATADDGVAIYSANSDKLDGSDASVFTGADTALGLATSTLQGNIDATNISTGSLRDETIVSTAAIVGDIASEVTNRTNADLAIGLDTATVETDSINRDLAIGLDTATIDTARVDGDLALGLATATLQTDITALETSTGTLPVLIIMDSTTLTNASTRDIVFSTGVFATPGSTWNVVLPAVAGNDGLSFTISMGVADNVLSFAVSGGGNISGVTPFTEIDAIYDCATFQVRNGEWVVTQKLITP